MAKDNGNFVDFMLAAQNKNRLLVEFLQQTNATQLHKFFQKHRFLGIDSKDCKKIIAAKQQFSRSLKQGFGQGKDYY
jgi:hypothetical protein